MTLARMQGHFRYFGLNEEDEDDEIKPRSTMEIDGYHVGDRLLEGVMFKLEVVDGKLTIDHTPSSKTYFASQGLDSKVWFGRLLEYAIAEDVFGEDEVSLVMDDDRYAYEWLED